MSFSSCCIMFFYIVQHIPFRHNIFTTTTIAHLCKIFNTLCIVFLYCMKNSGSDPFGALPRESIKIHAIKSTLSKAIKYICNEQKTDSQVLISSFGLHRRPRIWNLNSCSQRTKKAGRILLII